jgi:lysyl-tRNA synthetase class 2
LLKALESLMTEERQPEPGSNDQSAESNDQQQERQRSFEEIVRLGHTPYPHKFNRTHTISQIAHQFGSKTGEEMESAGVRVRAAGRVYAINKMGKAAFIRFTDGAELLQFYI